MTNLMVDLQQRLHEVLEATRRKHLSALQGTEKVKIALGDWTFDRGMLLLELEVKRGLRGAMAVVAIYEDHSETTITV